MKQKILLTLVTLFILACGATTNAIALRRPWREATHYIPRTPTAIVVTTTALPTPYVLSGGDGRKIQEWLP